MALSKTENSPEAIQRKVNALASDAVYNVSRGTVRPWKNVVLDLGISAFTGSKLAVQVLNRHGYCINYSEVKALEPEFAFSAAKNDREIPHGIKLISNLSTACVWDNNDANIKTLDGKTTLHATVGHTYQNISSESEEQVPKFEFRSGRNRRKYIGIDRNVPEFRRSFSSVTISFPFVEIGKPSTSAAPLATVAANNGNGGLQINNCYTVTPLQLYWFIKAIKEKLPLYAGFISQFIEDDLPMQRLCYNDPIFCSPTSNDVVRETMVRTLKIASETNQEFAVVTYDLAIAFKAYAIQALEEPRFDKPLILLINFHIELAFFGAVGTFLNGYGIETVLAEGSFIGFIKGKFYNRCQRIHELVAIVLERLRFSGRARLIIIVYHYGTTCVSKF